MGHKNRRQPKPPSSAPTSPPSATIDGDSSIKPEIVRISNLLDRQIFDQVDKLTEEFCFRHKDSAVVHRWRGEFFARLASQFRDSFEKRNTHLRNALNSTRRAVELCPNAIDYAAFHAGLLLQLADDSKSFEEVFRECERGLSLKNPVDPAESICLVKHYSTPEARIAHARGMIGMVIDETIDKMQPGPNEELRKEIKGKLTAARTLLQLPESPGQKVEGNTRSELSLMEKRQVRKVKNKEGPNAIRIEQLKSYWTTLSAEKKKGFFNVRIEDLKAHFGSIKDCLAKDILLEALAFAKKHSTWRFWECCVCGKKFADCESNKEHFRNEHKAILPQQLQSSLQELINIDCHEKLENGSWKPMDTLAMVKLIQNLPKSDFYHVVYRDHGETTYKCSDSSAGDVGDSFTKENSSQNHVKKSFKGALVRHEDGENCADNVCSVIYLDDQQFPSCDDIKRERLLTRIQCMFQLFLKHKCLTANLIKMVKQIAMQKLEALIAVHDLKFFGLDQLPLCLCLSGAPQLVSVLRFLEDLYDSFGLCRLPDTDAYTEDEIKRELGIKERVVFDSGFTYLILKLQSLHGELTLSSYDDGSTVYSAVADCEKDELPDGDAFISWLFSGPGIREELFLWKSLKEDKKVRGMEAVQKIEIESLLLRRWFKTRSDNLSYELAFEDIKDRCLREVNNRENIQGYVPQSYASILRKRIKELVEKEDDATSGSSRFELEILTNILNEAQSVIFQFLGFEEIVTGMKTKLHRKESHGSQEWEMQHHLQQVDACIEDVVKRQSKEMFEKHCKLERKILRSFWTSRQLEKELGFISVYDYRSIMLPLLREFMKAYMEELVDKYAIEKSDAGGEALLSELEREAEKNITKADLNLKKSKAKAKKRKKKMDHRKAKEFKASSGSEHLPHQEDTVQDHFLATRAADKPDTEVCIPEDADKIYQDIEEPSLEVEELVTKLEEALKNQLGRENEAEEKNLMEQETKMDMTEALCKVFLDVRENEIQYVLSAGTHSFDTSNQLTPKEDESLQQARTQDNC